MSEDAYNRRKRMTLRETDPDRFDVAYTEGYADGKKEALKNLPRCGSCKYWGGPNLTWMGGTAFCNHAKRPTLNSKKSDLMPDKDFGCVYHSDLEYD